MYNSFKNVTGSLSRGSAGEINAGSMADIAFLLLIFFLVTTTMSTDLGILRKLPQMTTDPAPVTLHKRDIMEVWINRDNQLMVRGELLPLNQLRGKAKEFISNAENLANLPKKETIVLKGIGSVDVTSNHLISLQSDRGTSYNTYVAVQNELTAAYNELRDEFSNRNYRNSFNDLSKEKQDIVSEVYPMRISEAEPNLTGE
ncbi:MAG: biopolymer transporter ExbD [Bacteroidales bacterium]|nr:biopolymer transporter ExbD [Bacteroidales bacterium]MBN2821462.1 biopolymer transporter ExbD [Bacteroidales bacterium]